MKLSEYKRIVSYLYEYQNGIRGDNIGFARIEAKDPQLKISFTLNTSRALSPLTLYFYYHQQGKMLVIPWDELSDVSRHYEYKKTFHIKEVLKQPISLSNLDGILFYYNDHSFYGSEWKGDPINLRLLKKPSTHSPQLEEYMEALSLHEQNEPPKIVPEHPIAPSASWETFPKITPLPTPDYSSCIKIQWHDMPSFAFLPQELQGNGFLKMQVQQYGHLMLAQKKLTDSHYIGIPGTFSNQRNFVARLFGFPEFITVPYKTQKTGNFGYWIMTIDH